MKIDYYKVLGIARDASANDIKQAFRKLALQFHPDRHVQSPIASREAAGHRFRQVSEAYEVLGDELKRAAYNNNGMHYAGTQGTGPSRRYEGPPRRRYYRRTKEGYSTYGSAQARSAHEEGSGVRWRPEPNLSAAERKERIINTIFFGFALPMFLFADYIGAAFWPKPHPGMKYDAGTHPEKPKAEECARRVKKAVQNSKMEKAPTTSSNRGSHDQGCKSLLGNRSVGYTYVASERLGTLQLATNLAHKLPESNPPSSSPQHLRSLLTMESKLSDLRVNEIYTWLRQSTWIPVNREST